jgi:hypothetical protein
MANIGRPDDERMRSAQREECTFPRSNLEYVITNIHVEFHIKNVEELMFMRVNMRRRRSVPLLMLESTESKAPPVSSPVASRILRKPLCQEDISMDGAC